MGNRNSTQTVRTIQDAPLNSTSKKQEYHRPSAPPVELSRAAVLKAAVQRIPLCDRYQCVKSCSDSLCLRLHLCRRFLAGICPGQCQRKHALLLDDCHNQDVCRRFLHDIGPVDNDELFSLIRQHAREKVSDSECLKSLETCFDYFTRFGCIRNDCNRLHFCKFKAKGHCRFENGGVCRKSHSLSTEHNIRVLDNHRALQLPASAVLDIICTQLRNREGKQAAAVVHIQSHTSGHNRPRKQRRNRSSAASKSGRNNNLLEALRCCVCLDQLERPVILDCGHSLCSKCWNQVRIVRHRCPQCNAIVNSTRRDYTLNNVLESLQHAKI